MFLLTEVLFNFKAQVVCKQLGFTGGVHHYTLGSFFGSVSSQFSYDEVECVGTEKSLDECRHDNNHNCGNSEGAGVICAQQGKHDIEQ